MTQENKPKGIPAFAMLVIVLSVFVGWLIYKFVLGAGANFEGATNEGKPLNLLGNMYKGGVIVPILIGILIIVLTFAIERLITVLRAKGNGSVETFVRKVRSL